MFYFPLQFLHILISGSPTPPLVCIPNRHLSLSTHPSVRHRIVNESSSFFDDGAEKVNSGLCPHSSHNWIEFQDIVALLSDCLLRTMSGKKTRVRPCFCSAAEIHSLMVRAIIKSESGSAEEWELMAGRMEEMQTRPKTDEIQLTGTLTHSGSFACSWNNEGILYKI